MAITKCRIWPPPVNRFTGAERELRQCGGTSDGWSALLMEKNMSKTDDTSKLDHAKLENCVLADSELDAVTGGKLLEAAVKGKVYHRVEIHGTA
jgi:hypothetical protein